jgi:hypothetical protein
MLCARCEGPVQPEAGRQAEWLQGLLCAACGALLGPEDLAQRVLRKHAQLAQFGLVSLSRPPRPPLRLEGD